MESSAYLDATILYYHPVDTQQSIVQ